LGKLVGALLMDQSFRVCRDPELLCFGPFDKHGRLSVEEAIDFRGVSFAFVLRDHSKRFASAHVVYKAEFMRKRQPELLG